MKHVFIINPIAGKGKSVEFKEKIENIFKDSKDEYEIIITKKNGYAIEKVREITEKEDCRIYSIGGDGTLNEVLNGMVGSNSLLGVIPAGSGNDFARTLYGDINCDNLLERIINGKYKEVDIGKLNDRYYLNIASIGFDANVVNNAITYKKKPFVSGSMAYIFSLLKTLFTFKSMELTFEMEGKKSTGDMYLIAAANGKCYGGGIKIAPKAEIDDGLLEIYAIEKPKVRRLIRFLPKVVTGKDTSNVKEIKYVRCKKLHVKSNKDTAVSIDGEISLLNDITFEIIPKGIKVIVPENLK